MGYAKPQCPILQGGDPLVAAGPPVLAMPFNEGSGQTVNDLSGRGNNGVLSAGATWTGGPFGSCLKFNGTTGSVNLPGTTSLDVTSTSGFSSFVWVNLTTTGTPLIPLLVLRAANGLPIWGLYVSNNGAFSKAGHPLPLIRDDSANLFSFGATKAVNDGNWHLVGMALSRDTSTFYCYVDNNVYTQTPVSPGSVTTSSSSQRYIGEDQNNSAFLTGLIDSPLIFHRFVSPAEVEALYFDSFRLYRRRGWRLKAATVASAALPNITIGSTDEQYPSIKYIGGEAVLLGGRPSKAVTPPTPHQPVVMSAGGNFLWMGQGAATEDQLSPARMAGGEALILGGRPSKAVTPPTPRQPVIAASGGIFLWRGQGAEGEDQLSPARMAGGEAIILGGRPNKPVTPPSLRLPIVILGTTDSYEGIALLFKPTTPKPVTSIPPTRPVINTAEDYTPLVPPPSIVLHSQVGLPVTPPSLRQPVVNTAEDYTLLTPPPSIILHSQVGVPVTPRSLRPLIISISGPQESTEGGFLSVTPVLRSTTVSPLRVPIINTAEDYTPLIPPPSVILHSQVGLPVTPRSLRQVVVSAGPWEPDPGNAIVLKATPGPIFVPLRQVTIYQGPQESEDGRAIVIRSTPQLPSHLPIAVAFYKGDDWIIETGTGRGAIVVAGPVRIPPTPLPPITMQDKYTPVVSITGVAGG